MCVLRTRAESERTIPRVEREENRNGGSAPAAQAQTGSIYIDGRFLTTEKMAEASARENLVR